MLKNIVLVVLVVALVVVGLVLVASSPDKVADKVAARLANRLAQLESAVTNLRLGAQPGTEFFDGLYFTVERSTDGVIASEVSTSSITVRQICQDKYIELGFATSGVYTVTLPSGQQLFSSCFRSPEATRTVYVRNVTSSGISINLAAGASSTLFNVNAAVSTSTVTQIGTTTLSAGTIGELTAIRIASGTQAHILWLLEVFRNL